ncbi:MAG: hypothetical protein WC011_00235 [Candidatus Paceibacterota bacterium]
MQLQIETVEMLKKAGKLERKLVYRIIMLFFITLITFVMLVYDLFLNNLNLFGVVFFSIFGFVLGFYIFTRMNKVVWDQKREIVAMGKFDLTSFVLVLIYIAYRIEVGLLLKDYYGDGFEVYGFSLATIFGGMLGRFIGTFYSIHKAHIEK